MKIDYKGKEPKMQKKTFKTRPDMDKNTLNPWWMEDKPDKRAAQLLTTAAYLKESQAYRYRQAAIFARMYGNQSLYSFAGSNIAKIDNDHGLPQDRPTFNLVQSVTDTLVSRLSQSRPQPVFLTDNGDYKQRNLAKKLNNFTQGEFYNIKAYEKAAIIIRDSLVEGTGVAHIYETPDHRVGMERVFLTELLIDPNEAMYGEPRQLYRLKLYDRDVLAANFPDHFKKIEMAAESTPDNSSDASKKVSDLVMVVEGWHLPSGKGQKDGRHTLAISSGYLIDEQYDKDKFPFVFLHYSPRLLGFWAQGVAEQLMGTQIELNQILFTISRSIKLMGVPRIFIEDGSKVVSAHINNEIGSIIKYRGQKPLFETATCNAAELYAERDKLIEYGYQQSGVSALQASSQKPQGLDSGEAIRTYDDISTDRFASLSRRYDNFFIDIAYLVIDLAKDIAIRDGKYASVYPAKNGTKEIDLPKAVMVKEDPYIIQCFSQSSLPKDPAGRLQKVTEMVQSGMVTLQEGRRLLDYPDLEQVEKLANAGEERIFQILDDIVEDGKYVPPDPFIDLVLATQLTTQYINLYASAKLEEKKMDLLMQFFQQIQDIKTQAMAAMAPLPGAGAPQPQASPEAPPTSPLIPNTPGAQPQPMTQ